MLDLGLLGTVTFDAAFVSGFLSIVLIDLILARDNAIVVAMVAGPLGPKQRMKGIIFGAGAAVLLRAEPTFLFVMLQINYLKRVRGVVTLWIAVKLSSKEDPTSPGNAKPPAVLPLR